MEKIKCCKKDLCLVLGLAVLAVVSIVCAGLLRFTYSAAGSVVTYLMLQCGALAVGVALMLLAAQFGRELLEQFCWCLPLVAILVGRFMSGNMLSLFGRSVEVMPLVSVLALAGMAVYFDRYAVHSSVHMTAYGVMNLALALEFRGEGVMLIMLLVLNLFLFVGAVREKQLRTKYDWLVSLCVLVVMTFFATRRVVYGIFDWSAYANDPQYIIVYIRKALGNLRAFGGGNPLTISGGDSRTYRLIWIMEGLGWVPGVVTVVALVAFNLAILRKNCTASAADRPLVGAVTTLVLIPTVVFLLANFGFVLNGVFAQVPILSGDTCGYFAAFLMVGLLLNSDKAK